MKQINGLRKHIRKTLLEKFGLDENLFLKHDKANDSLVVFSDEADGKKNFRETFLNKDKLKAAGFVWNGKKWTIPTSQLEQARNILNKINKITDSNFIQKLEDLEEYIQETAPFPGKDDIKSKISSYIEDLAQVTDEAALSSAIRKYLTFFAKFRDHSMHNTLLIYLQNPNATKVAGFKQWQEKFHRGVKKGAKSITIFAPMIKKSGETEVIDTTVEKDFDKEVEEKSTISFRPVLVFDIANTYALDERGEVPEEPEWFSKNEPNETADELYNYATVLADDMGVKITSSDSEHGEQGYSSGDHINVSSNTEDASKLATLIHEIAHELMHWKKTSIFYIDAQNIENQDKFDISARALRELQAESVSYVVLKHYDIPVGHHPTYLALWKANGDLIKKNINVISKVSNFIIDNLERIRKEEAVKQ